MMAPKLYAHPFSSYCQKAITAFYEKAAPFELALLAPENPQAGAELRTLWPMERFPALAADGRTVVEATTIIEWLETHVPDAPRLIPADPDAALETRMRDRIFDNYVMEPMQRIVADRLRPDSAHDPHGVAGARQTLDRAYDWLDREMTSREWAIGESFTMADCAAAPSLFYANWVHPFAGRAALDAYFARLYARPSFARAVDEARPYRPLFPGGAPTDRG